MNDRKALDVYVRLGNDGNDDRTRVISFQIPEGFSQAALLAVDYAIDGNSAVMTIEAGRDEYNPRSLEQSLLDEQNSLVEWLGKKGFDVVFK